MSSTDIYFSYNLQLPNLNISYYTPNVIHPNKILSKLDNVKVDLSLLPKSKNETLAFGTYYLSGPYSALIYSACINSSYLVHQGAIPKLNFEDIPIRFPTFVLNNYGSMKKGQELEQFVYFLNDYFYSKRIKFKLYALKSWEDMLLTLASGFSPMIGGTVYNSFTQSVESGIIPMPKPKEDLLGSHIFNLVEFNINEDVGNVILNTNSFNVQKKDFALIRGSYIRNLNICQDFFVLIPELTS